MGPEVVLATCVWLSPRPHETAPEPVPVQVLELAKLPSGAPGAWVLPVGKGEQQFVRLQALQGCSVDRTVANR